MVGRRALVVVWERSRRGHDARAVAWVGRRRAWPSCVTGRRVALSDGCTGFWRQIGSETLRGYEDVSLRTAGPLDRAGCGPKHLPFMGGSLEGEGKRRADGPLPPLTSELGGRFFCGWADGDSAWCPKGGNTADSPSNPGQYGGLVCPIRAIWDMTGRADGGGCNQRTRAFCQLVRFGWLACVNNAYLGRNGQLVHWLDDYP